MRKVALFIPTFNEQEAIAGILSAIPNHICGYPTVIVIADDCSTDETVLIARQFTDFVTTSTTNQGVGAATRNGIAMIDAMEDVDFIVKFDGDGQHKLDLLPVVVDHLANGNDLVICSRFHPLSDQAHTPTDRILLNMIFTEMIRKITSWKVTDVRSGYMGFPIRYARILGSDLIVQRYGVPMEIILRIWDLKPDAKIEEVPHPALYGPHISEKLAKKYSSETISSQADRLHIAYESLLTVINDLEIPRELILEMNGFAKHSYA
jgi:glycosyltransferase involved in cell wall biosynthesis